MKKKILFTNKFSPQSHSTIILPFSEQRNRVTLIQVYEIFHDLLFSNLEI